MRLNRVIGPVNWKSALGELTLIVIGITLALAGNSWYEERQERNEELQVLSQFREALENDRQEFQRIYETERDVHQRVTALLAHSRAKSHTVPMSNRISALSLCGVDLAPILPHTKL